MEEWRAIPNWEGRYEVSNGGRVRHVGTGKGSTLGRVMRPSQTSGYPHVVLKHRERIQGCYVHRLVALAFLGAPPDPTMNVNHKDGNKAHNHPDNLEWVTPSENIQHGIRTGLIVSPGARAPRRGAAVNFAKLNDDTVRAIKALRGTASLATIGRRFGVSKGTISLIYTGQTWAHVT